mmetsp:Transcript_69874/g.216036  ORF Transcript_69874/g.216036 Transcript_69874/m.216036 type:complete len:253 (+) Transcript_69874:495-1253(+)
MVSSPPMASAYSAGTPKTTATPEAWMKMLSCSSQCVSPIAWPMMICPSGRSMPCKPRSLSIWSSLMYIGRRFRAMREDIGIMMGMGNIRLASPSLGGFGHRIAPTGFCFRFMYARCLHVLNSCKYARMVMSSPSAPCKDDSLSNVMLKVFAGRILVASKRTRRPSLRALPTSEGDTIGSCEGRPRVSKEACIFIQSQSMPPECAKTCLVRLSTEGPCWAFFLGTVSLIFWRSSFLTLSGTTFFAFPDFASCI